MCKAAFNRFVSFSDSGAFVKLQITSILSATFAWVFIVVVAVVVVV